MRPFQSQEAIYKRLPRARATLRQQIAELETPAIEALATRLPAVLHTRGLLLLEEQDRSLLP